MLEDKLSFTVLVIFGLITLLQLVYYYVLYARFAFSRKKKAVAMQQVPVSVIVVIKDAANSLLKFMPRIMSQQYSQFELVIVNDHSHDLSELLVKEYQSQYANIKLVNLDSAVSTIRGNKFALSMGVRCASYEHLLFTDVECSPTSMHWLEKMAENFVSQKQIVLGYSSYDKRNSLFNRLLHFDNLHNAIQYFSLAMCRSTYRGDLRNMAFTKTLFYDQKGFASHNHLSCGEEDIFVSRASNKQNTAVEFAQEAFTITHNKVPYSYWKDHKMGLYYTRHLNTMKNRFLLGLYAIVNLLFYVGLALAIWATAQNPLFLWIVLGIAALRVLSQYLVYGFAAHKLNEKQVIPFLLLYDIIFAVMNPLYFLSAHIYHHKFK